MRKIFNKIENLFTARLYYLSIIATIFSIIIISLFCADFFTEESRDKNLISGNSQNVNTPFSASNNEGVLFQEKGTYAFFANHYIGMEFSTAGQKLLMSRLYGFEQNQDFISPKTSLSLNLWTLILRKDGGRDKKEVALSSLDDAATSLSIIGSKAGERTLILNWKGLSINNEKNIIDVDVKITLKANDPNSLWRINVNNRSKDYGLWNVYFPVLKLVPIGTNAEDNYFVVGKSRGVLVKDPFRSNPKRAFGFASKGGVTWPGGLNMQFQALYNADRNGLYIATHDGGGYKKKFYFFPDPKNLAMEYKIGHFPPNMGFPAEDYHMSYDVVVRPFIGDWYDAAQIYRSWALKQSWCKNGNLKTRQDIPQWFKETPIMLKVTSKKGSRDLSRLKKRIIDFIDFIDIDLPVNWYTWKKYMPGKTAFNSIKAKLQMFKRPTNPVSNIHDGNYPELPALSGFQSVCDDISKVGGHVLPYMCARIFDPGIDENSPFAKDAKPNSMKSLDGDITYANGGLTWKMCYHSKWWQDRLKETVSELMNKEHASGIYFDAFYGGYVQCFDTNHGHTHGGGNSPYIGAKKIATVIRKTMKNIDKESVMTGESPSETAIDLLDGFLYRWTTWPDMLPLFATVYGDYIPRYGMEINPKSDGFYIQSAVLFLEGAIMGRLSLHGDDLLKDFDNGSVYTEEMKFLRKLARYRSTEMGKKYLAYGQLLRPLSTLKMNPDLSVSYKESNQRYKNGEITSKALQSGVFKAKDGSIGIFVVNVSVTPVSFSFNLNSDEYPLLNKQFKKVITIDEYGQMLNEEEYKIDRLKIEKKMESHDVLFLCIRPKKQ